MIERPSQPAVAVLCLLAILSTVACNKSATTSNTARRFHLKGKIVSLDKPSGTANVAAESIPGFMDAMTMPYEIHPAAQLDQLAPGDSIEADVVIDNDKYWLENVSVKQHAAAPPAKPTAEMHYPQPGDAVPNFEFTNQNGRRVSLDQFRGQALLLTFIYTRCPFPDYCPRITRQFAEIHRKLAADPALDAKTHLLSISFDPAHDTPAVLREYGFTSAGTRQPSLFHHWEFVVPSAKDLPALANFFGVTHEKDGAVITHSLSTAVIGPGGKIVWWNHDADWQPSDVIQAAANALHSAG